MDREKVIKATELLDDYFNEYREVYLISPHEAWEIIKDTLKEQEPVPCGEKIKAGDVMLDFYECVYCKNAIRKPWKYCPFCGKEVKWDGFDRKAFV